MDLGNGRKNRTELQIKKLLRSPKGDRTEAGIPDPSFAVLLTLVHISSQWYRLGKYDIWSLMQSCVKNQNLGHSSTTFSV